MQFGWKSLFLVFGLLGAPLLAIWLALTPKQAPPDDHSNPSSGGAAAVRGTEVNKSESSGVITPQKSEGRASVGKLLSHPATWAIIIVNIVNHWGYFIYLNWMPSYFSKVRPDGRAVGVLYRSTT